MSLKHTLNNLHPKHKRLIAIGGGVLGLFLAVHFLGGGSTDRSSGVKREEAIRNVLTDHNTRDISLDSLSATVNIVRRENEDLKKEMTKLNAQLERAAKNQGSSIGLESQLELLRDDMAQLRQQAEIQAKAAEEAALQAAVAKDAIEAEAQAKDEGALPVAEGSLLDRYKTATEVFEQAPAPRMEQRNSQTGEVIPLRITSYTQKRDDAAAPEESKDDVYMPAGSILTGSLLNGLDAPTGQGARRDPFPSTIRLQKEAILPNRFQADVRECFLIVSGYGELSTERAMLRGENISCIREDGGVIESKVRAYVVGEDGKAGVRGRLVSKQGQIIAKSLMAGFASGLANAFDVNPVPVLNTAPDGRTQYQRTFSNDMLQGAGMKGASNALERVADFYIEMAESMFPVVEVDAGRQVDIILNGGLSLKLRKGDK